MNKSFKQYLAESVHTYKYKIKIVGDYDTKTLDLFRANLAKFNPVKIDQPRRTPIQAEPFDFPKFENQPVIIMDSEFMYPVIEPDIKQIWRILGNDENRIRLVDELGAEIEDRQEARIHDGKDFEADARKASEDYGDSYLQWLKQQRKQTEYPQQFDAKTTPVSDPFKREKVESFGPVSGRNRRV